MPRRSIREARSRQRKRRLLVGIAVLIVGAASGIWASSSRSSGTKPTSSSKGLPRFKLSVPRRWRLRMSVHVAAMV